MKFTKTLMALGMLSQFTVANAAHAECSVATDLNNGAICSITATRAGSIGVGQVKFFPAYGGTLTNDEDQAVLNKLLIVDLGWGMDVATPQDYGFGNLLSNGVSVLMVSRQASTEDSVQDHAYVLEDVLRFISDYRDDTKKMVVTGFSLGGVAARYALADMEEIGEPHNVSLYVSFDTPHRGIHVPQSVQLTAPVFNEYVSALLAAATSANAIQTQLGMPALLLDVANKLAVVKQTTIDAMNYTIDSKVIGQLAIDNIMRPADHEEFMTDLHANGLPGSNGYPINLRKIAVSAGSYAVPQTLPLHDLAANPNNPNGANNAYYSFNGEKGSTNVYAFLKFNAFPTAASNLAIDANAGAIGTFTTTYRCFFFFTCKLNNTTTIAIPKSRYSELEASAFDRVPGSYYDWGQYVDAFSRDPRIAATFTKSLKYTNKSVPGTEIKLTLVPTFSAFDVDPNVDGTVNIAGGIAEDVIGSPFEKTIYINYAGTSNRSHAHAFYLEDHVVDEINTGFTN